MSGHRYSQAPHRLRGRALAPSVITLITAICCLGLAAALAKLLPRDTGDDLYPFISALAAGGILLIVVAGVAVVSVRWSNRVLALVTAVCLVIAAVAYPTSQAEQDLPVVVSFGTLYPLGGTLGLACLLVLVVRVTQTLVRKRPPLTPRGR